MLTVIKAVARYPVYLLAATGYTLAQTAPPPGQPIKSGANGQFELIGNSLVSAQQVSSSLYANFSFLTGFCSYFSGQQIKYTLWIKQKTILRKLMDTLLGLLVINVWLFGS